jgi:hypothetical protein
LEEAFHDDLRSRAVERADHRQRQDAFPQLHHRRGEFEHLILLPRDDFFPGFLVFRDRDEAKLVQQVAGLLHRFPQVAGILNFPAQDGEHGILQREHECRGLRRGVAAAGAFVGKLGEERPDGLPVFGLDVVQLSPLCGVGQQRQELLRLFGVFAPVIAEIPRCSGRLQSVLPESEQLFPVGAKRIDRGEFGLGH